MRPGRGDDHLPVHCRPGQPVLALLPRLHRGHGPAQHAAPAGRRRPALRAVQARLFPLSLHRRWPNHQRHAHPLQGGPTRAGKAPKDQLRSNQRPHHPDARHRRRHSTIPPVVRTIRPGPGLPLRNSVHQSTDQVLRAILPLGRRGQADLPASP
uniref:(northern house mosquito) hypothetical protein n=1 Tax=Culex pipiens TaxID=7175 RepID=A0A8D8L2A0_CULPI